MDSLAAITSDQLSKIALYAIVLVVIWIALRIILRIAHRIFVFGCGAILVLVLLLILMRFLSPN
jgi:hypothetical protein